MYQCVVVLSKKGLFQIECAPTAMDLAERVGQIPQAQSIWTYCPSFDKSYVGICYRRFVVTVSGKAYTLGLYDSLS